MTPSTGKKTVVVPPLRFDICVTHCAVCDQFGNGREGGFVECILHHAANKVMITTDKIVPLSDTEAHMKEVTIYGEAVDAVVEVPWGAYPGGSQGAGYSEDAEHLREHEKTKVMRVKEVFPGHTVDEVVSRMGFNPVVPANVPESEPPTVEEVEFMRSFDPDGILPKLTEEQKLT
jgi:hypothetical protein